jgi:hypothetical protein
MFLLLICSSFFLGKVLVARALCAELDVGCQAEINLDLKGKRKYYNKEPQILR